MEHVARSGAGRIVAESASGVAEAEIREKPDPSFVGL
jgi:hypothetical protein